MTYEVRRADFQSAIEAGLTAAGDLLTEAEREALRKVGREASSVGINFDSCPLTQAGLFDDTNTNGSWETADARRDDYAGARGYDSKGGWVFVNAYDQAILSLTSLSASKIDII